jgi:hypothetical protein
VTFGPRLQRDAGGAITISVRALAWAGVSVLFLLLRLGPIWQMRVGGFELVQLSGAWTARIGEPDDRFVPTLFQALTTLSLHWTTSEIPARILAFAACATIPVALYVLRPRLGEGGALLALALLALDGPTINFGASASAMGFDLPIAVWLFVLLSGASIPQWGWAPVGFVVATAGPLPLPLIGAFGVLALLRRQYPPQGALVAAAAGALAGMLAASLRFGLGFDGLRVPPFDLFAAGFEERWASLAAFKVGLIYSAPIILGGAAVVVGVVVRWFRWADVAERDLALLAWTAVAGAWFAAAAASESSVPVVALVLPLALLLGPALASAIGAMMEADWYYARVLVPGALGLMAIVAAVVVQWARDGHPGDAGEKLAVGGFTILALAIAALLAANRDSLPALLPVAVLVSLFPVISGATAVAFSAQHDFLASPFSPPQASELRDIALQTVAEKGGTVVVHPQFTDDITWPFRDSGEMVVASRVPPQATVIVWPADLPAPEGVAALDGEWNVLRQVPAPSGGFLRHVRWFTDRNSLDIKRTPVAVYVRASE